MRTKGYVFLYEKKMLNYKFNGHPCLATWQTVRDITIMRELEKIKTVSDEHRVKFDYRFKPDWNYEDEGKI